MPPVPWSATRTPTRWRPPSARCSLTRRGAGAMAEAGRRRLAELDLATAADRFVDLLVGLTQPAGSA